MPQFKILSEKEILEQLEKTSGWGYGGGKLSKKYELKDFRSAVDWVHRLVEVFEKKDHHPEIHVLYKVVVFELSTHAANDKVTNLDFETARAIDDNFKLIDQIT